MFLPSSRNSPNPPFGGFFTSPPTTAFQNPV
nr:MAG TPA: hypothetical protein [Caudoviricetes sp.]